MQGLYEIREAAKALIAIENRKRNTKWEVLDPDIRHVLTLCAVPMKTKFLLKSPDTNEPHVLVRCSKTVRPKIEKNWELPIIVYIPTKVK